MKYNYAPLWKQLKLSGMTKTELREKTNISTSTLAKLSAGDAVSLDVILRIAKVLGCTVNEIISTTDAESTTRWSSITPNLTFTIRMVFHIDDVGNVLYITGSAITFNMPAKGMDTWYLSKYPNHKKYYLLDGCADSEALTDLLKLSAGNHTLGNIFEASNITLKCNKVNDTTKSIICNAYLCGGNLTYHPPYIMLPLDTCRTCKPEAMPIVSPTDSIMICEGYENPYKQCLYVDNGTINEKKQEEILSIIRKEFPKFKSTSDIIHLGNFEVLTVPSGVYDENAGIHITPIKPSTPYDQEMSFKILLAHQQINKTVIVEFITYSDANPTNDTIAEFDCRTEDKTWNATATLPCTAIEIKMWQFDRLTMQFGSLLYHTKHFLITDIPLHLQIVENEHSLNDAWSKKIEKAQKTDNLKPVQTTQIDINDRTSASNYNYALKRDFKRIIEKESLPGRSIFLNKGDDKQVEFLLWLKNAVNMDDVKKVILIDPYIDLKAVTACLRCACDYDQKWELYTDIKKKPAAEIEELRTSLSLSAPPNFNIWGVKGILHDRYLMLIGNQSLRVYAISNSIDAVSEHYASSIIGIDNDGACQIFNYYLNLLGNAEKETIFSSDDLASGKGENIPTNKLNREYIIMPPEYIGQKATDTQTAKELILSFLENGSGNLYPHHRRECLFAYELLCITGNINDYVLTRADSFNFSSVNYHHYSWKSEALYDALCYLRDNNIDEFMNIIEYVTENKNGGEMPDLALCYTSMLILYSISIEAITPKYQHMKLKSWLAGNNSTVSAIILTGFFEHNRDNVTQNLKALTDNISDFKELIFSAIFLMKKALLSKRFKSDTVGEIIDYIVSHMKKNATVDIEKYLSDALLPLYPSFQATIVKLLEKTIASTAISNDTAEHLILHFLTKKYLDCINNTPHITICIQDLTDSCNYIDLLIHTVSDSGSKISDALRKIERKADTTLYNPTLKYHNYSSWKNNIDVFGSMVYLELYLEKAHNIKPDKTPITEYVEICKNYESTLVDHSEIYNAVLKIMKC